MKKLKNTSIFSKYDMIYSILNITKRSEISKDVRKKERILTLTSLIIRDLNIISKIYFDESFSGYLNKKCEFCGTEDEAIEVLTNIIHKKFRNK